MRKWFPVAAALVLCLAVTSGAMAASISAKGTSKSLGSLAGRIVGECVKPGMSQFEKAIALYDWLIVHTEYRGGVTNPYYVLRDGEGSCSGYANAYNALLAKAGIKSKAINGRAYAMKHTWNLIYLDGRWYHVDVRLGDHLKASEGRYRRFGMSDEQARLYYSFKKTKANDYSSNYAYKTGQLEHAVAYVRSKILNRAEAGEKLFILDLTAENAPSELSDPMNRITVKNALKKLECAYPGIPDKARVTLALTENLLLVTVNVPTYRILGLTSTAPASIVINVEGNDFSAVQPLELGDSIQITPAYATQKKLYWSSRREKIAVVDQHGRVSIVGFGVTVIKAAAIDGSKRTCAFTLTVKAA